MKIQDLFAVSVIGAFFFVAIMVVGRNPIKYEIEAQKAEFLILKVHNAYDAATALDAIEQRYGPMKKIDNQVVYKIGDANWRLHHFSDNGSWVAFEHFEAFKERSKKQSDKSE